MQIRTLAGIGGFNPSPPPGCNPNPDQEASACYLHWEEDFHRQKGRTFLMMQIASTGGLLIAWMVSHLIWPQANGMKKFYGNVQTDRICL